MEKIKKIIETIKSDYIKLKSLSVRENDNCIYLDGVRYRGYDNAATMVDFQVIGWQWESNGDNYWILTAELEY